MNWIGSVCVALLLAAGSEARAEDTISIGLAGVQYDVEVRRYDDLSREELADRLGIPQVTDEAIDSLRDFPDLSRCVVAAPTTSDAPGESRLDWAEIDTLSDLRVCALHLARTVKDAKIYSEFLAASGFGRVSSREWGNAHTLVNARWRLEDGAFGTPLPLGPVQRSAGVFARNMAVLAFFSSGGEIEALTVYLVLK